MHARHQPELPYWYLRSDAVWEIPGADHLEVQAGGFPRMPGLRVTRGRIPDRFAQALVHDPALVTRIVSRILDDRFEASLHEDILAAVGFDRDVLAPPSEEKWSEHIAEDERETTTCLRRSPSFREEVSSVYDRRCALTGFQAMMPGRSSA